MATMILYYYGVPEYENSEQVQVQMIVDFMLTLKNDLDFLISDSNQSSKSNFYSAISNAMPNFNLEQFKSSFNEAFGTEFNSLLKNLGARIDNRVGLQNVYRKLRSVGLTGESLKLKLTLVSEWWSRVEASRANNRLNWNSGPIRRVIRKFLGYLNSILGSLAKIFTSIEPIKEFKEYLESAEDLIDEVAK